MGKQCRKVTALVICCLFALPAQGDGPESMMQAVSTFSIVSRDPATGDLGVAVASRYFAVGSVVPWAEAGVGAVATQANVNVRYGPRALDLLRGGLTAAQVLATILDEDNLEGKNGRQVAILDAAGNIAVHTGPGAPSWAGHKQGKTWSAQGNLLVGPEVIEAMGRAFQDTSGELAERLYAAVKAGDDAGGDRRGRQSAALLVVGKNKGRNLNNDRYVFIHVDDHPAPLQELRRLLDLNLAYHYQSEALRAAESGKLPEMKVLLTRAAPYCRNPDTRIRQGFLAYLSGDKHIALREFQRVQSDADFRRLWDALVEIRPAFAIVERDLEFCQQLFGRECGEGKTQVVPD